MAEDEVKLANGQRWTRQQFLDHYFQPSASGMPVPVGGPPEPVIVDRSWYMGEGPGRYYHPGMFPIINRIVDRHDLVPDKTYDLWDLAPENKDDPSVKAKISHYFTDPRSGDYKTRAFVFGNESARISGKVAVGADGSKTFQGIEIRPFDTNFDFEHNTRNPAIEIPRELARRKYDPQNLGAKYDIRFPKEGPGRVYYPFTDSQLKTALQDPGEAPPGLLPSVTGDPPPFIKQHLQYLDQTKGAFAPGQSGASPDVGDKPVRILSGGPGSNPSLPLSGSNTPPVRFALPSPRNASGGIANWIAGLAGVDPQNPTQPARSPQADQLNGFDRDDPDQPWFIRSRR